MANSKSNIYPIQLQGAELNLNKLDAEIKQYSGFNKNNSPFVGGCLSNVFEKKEDIEGATSENTYIDSNGDIYRVSESGLYKNDTLIFAKEGEALEQIGVDLPPNLVCFYNDEVYITKEESNTDNPFGYYVFHCGDYEEIYKPWEVSGTAISYYISECSFDIEHIYDERLGDIYCVATQVRSLLKMYIYTKDAEGNVVNSFFTFYSGYGG